MTDTHDVYPNAPLALVAVEVRFPSSAGVSPLPMNLQRSFRDLLGEGWVIQSQKVQQMTVAVSAAGAVPQAMPMLTIPRFTVRDRTLAVAITEESVTIEATRYRHYPTFRETVESAVVAAAEVLLPDGIARVGMRYIDEIRVPGIREEDLSDWRDWIDTSLLAPQLGAMCDAGFGPSAWEGAAQYRTGPNQKLVLRYGPRTSYVVSPVGPLQRPSPPGPGSLFALDFDCFWEPPDIPEFDPEIIMDTCDQLRRPIRALFDMLVTDKLLAEFTKEGPVG
ncbi:MAG: TIGR04255 family protein [Actinomycetota bacterium]|nr:TIGR04255 family protein [Actinomycetota bacterium]